MTCLQEASAYNRPEPMAAHQPPSSSLQPNPSAAIMSGYHPPTQAERPQAPQPSTSGRASGLSHASTATGVNLPATQSDLAGGASDCQAGQGQASSSGSQQSLQGDSPKARWSAVAANQDQPGGRPRGVSPPSEDVSSSGEDTDIGFCRVLIGYLHMIRNPGIHTVGSQPHGSNFC